MEHGPLTEIVLSSLRAGREYMQKLRSCLPTISIVLPLFCIAIPTAEAGEIKLTGGVPIVIDTRERPPIHRAVEDLRRDLAKVFGVESPLHYDLAVVGKGPVIVVTCNGKSTARFRNPEVRGFEAHAVFAKELDNVPCVVLQGSDMRGAIYAIYSFSEHVLGVPPLWIWASVEPERKIQIALAGDYERIFPPPYVKWRAWFPNDRDLLNPWQTRSRENYEALFETMLRLKMNTLEGRLMDKEAFNRPHTAGLEARIARDRGLVVTGHHIYTFGASMRDWDLFWRLVERREPPRVSIHNLDALKTFWRHHIDTALAERMEVIWLIGFRADRDAPFWAFYEDAPATDAERGRIIEKMMREQVALLKEVTSDATPPMRTTLYNEKSDLCAAGLLRPPNEPTLIWNFVAARRDHFPAADIQRFELEPDRPIGYYMNLQFTSTGAHLAQAEGPWKMERNYRYVNGRSPRPLEFSVVNAGNIREFVLTLSANARLLWDFTGYDSDEFLKSFCTTYFGKEHAETAAGLYRDFFDSYWRQKRSDQPGFPRKYLFQDMRYARAMEQICASFAKGYNPNPLVDKGFSAPGEYFRIVPEDSGARNQLEAIVKGTDASKKQFESVAARCDALIEKLPPKRRKFFNDNLRIQARFMMRLNEALGEQTRGYMALREPKSKKAPRHVEASLKALSQARSTLAEAEHGRFVGWYAGDEKFRLGKMRERLTELHKYLTGTIP